MYVVFSKQLFLYVLHLGVYGDVLRVKILYNKKDGALVQMAEPHQAHLGEYIRIIINFFRKFFFNDIFIPFRPLTAAVQTL